MTMVTLAEAGDPIDEIILCWELARLSAITALYGPDSYGNTYRDDKFVKLLQSFVREIASNTAAIDSGDLRLGLAVSAPHGPASEVARLSDIARSHTWLTFWGEVDHHLLDSGDQDRLTHIATALGRAQARESGDERRLNQIAVDMSSTDVRELTWRFLFALRVMQVRLEGDHPEDRTQMIGHLSRVTASADFADKVYSHLELEAGRYAISRGVVTEQILRRDLRGKFRIDRSLRLDLAWGELDRLADTVMTTTRRTLSHGASELHLPRADELAELTSLCTEVSAVAQVLVVTGGPDVGKSALSMDVVAGLRTGGAEVIVLNLRDLPPNVHDWEARLQARLQDVFALSGVDPIRLLVVDGAEAVLEKHRPIAQELCRHALSAHMGVVLIARIDAAGAVRGVAVAGAQAAGIHLQVWEPRRMDVEPIAAPLIQQVVETFPMLDGLASTPRGRRILSRVGLVELILHADVAGELPNGALSEVDILNAVWMKWIRCGEVQSSNGAMPDERDWAVCMAAEDALHQRPVRHADGAAVASLRSDGVFSPVGSAVASLRANPLTDDLVRDLATAMIFIRAGSFADLSRAQAPRTAVRAARLAIQAIGQSIVDDEAFLAWMAQVQAEFSGIASVYGARWSDLPLEALLLTPIADRVLTICDSGQRTGTITQRQILEVLKRRFVVSRVCDPVLTAPAVRYLIRSSPSVASGNVGTQAVVELVAAWLRGWVNLPPQDRDADLEATFELVEQHIVENADTRSELWLESLALLGPLPGSNAEILLQSVAAQRPQDLWACVEQYPAINALAAANLDLLIRLADAFYIVPNAFDRRGRLLPNDDGIRDHHNVGWNGLPAFSPAYGPFYRILQSDYDKGVSFIGRLIAHATSHVPPSDSPFAPKPRAVPTFKANILDVGERTYQGDAATWQWHQGVLGAYGPCTSALQALEMFTSRAITQGQPAPTLLRRIAARATTAAELALILNLVARRTEPSSRDLDGFIAAPEVWLYEHVRHTAWALHRRSAKPTDQARFGWDFIDLVRSRLVLPAVGSSNPEAKVRLENVKRNLDNALGQRTSLPESGPASLLLGDDQYLGQASTLLDAASWRVETTDSGQKVGVNEALLSSGDPALGQQLAQGNIAHRLEYKYVPDWEPPLNYGGPFRPGIDELLADIATVRQLDRSQPFGPLDLLQPAVAVAGAAAVVLAEGVLADAEVAAWARSEVVAAAAPSVVEHRKDLTSTTADPHSAMASAAAALPHLLKLNNLSPERESISEALYTALTDPVAEVRRICAWSTTVVWEMPCEGEPCIHQVTWRAVEAGIRSIGYDAPLTETTSGNALAQQTIEADVSRLDLHLLVGSIISAMQATRTASCVQADAQQMADALLQLYQNGLRYRGARHLREWETAAVTEQLLRQLEWETDVAGSNADSTFDQSTLSQHLLATKDDVTVASQNLKDLAYIGTYITGHRATLKTIWAKLMAVHLSQASEASHLVVAETLLASMVPTPSPSPYRIDEFEVTLAAARADWIPLTSIAAAIEQWTVHSRGLPSCADSLVGYLKTCDATHQIDPGLRWIKHLVEAEPSSFVNRISPLADWLTELSSADSVRPEQSHTYNFVIDLLAAAGDTEMISLQRRRES